MVVIRLARIGKKKAPIYGIMVADKDCKLTGRHLEKIGTYAPGAGGQKALLMVNQERLSHWKKLGAQPTARLLKVLSSQVAAAK